MKQFRQMTIKDLEKLYNEAKESPDYAQKVIEAVIKEEKVKRQEAEGLILK